MREDKHGLCAAQVGAALEEITAQVWIAPSSTGSVYRTEGSPGLYRMTGFQSRDSVRTMADVEVGDRSADEV